MFNIFQSLLIAAPIFWLGLGVLIATRAKLRWTRKPPSYVVLRAYTSIVLISPWLFLAHVGEGGVVEIAHRDDD